MNILMLKKAPTKNENRAMSELYAGLERHTNLKRSDVRVEYLIEEQLPKDRKPNAEETTGALLRMFDLLATVTSDIIVTAGVFATRAVMGPVDMAAVHGIPHAVTVAGRALTVFPMYDPAAGLGNKGFLAALAYDLKASRAFRS